jgi:hypothetical protein
MHVFLRVSLWLNKMSSCLILLESALRAVGFVEKSIALMRI